MVDLNVEKIKKNNSIYTTKVNVLKKKRKQWISDFMIFFFETFCISQNLKKKCQLFFKDSFIFIIKNITIYVCRKYAGAHDTLIKKNCCVYAKMQD